MVYYLIFYSEASNNTFAVVVKFFIRQRLVLYEELDVEGSARASCKAFKSLADIVFKVSTISFEFWVKGESVPSECIADVRISTKRAKTGSRVCVEPEYGFFNGVFVESGPFEFDGIELSCLVDCSPELDEVRGLLKSIRLGSEL